MLKKVPILRSTSMSIALGGGQTEFLLLWTFVCWPSLIDFLRNLGHWMVNGSEKKSMLKKVLILRFISMSIALGGSDWIFAALDFCVLANFVFLDFLRNLGHWMVDGSEKNIHVKESADSEVYFHVNCTGGGQTEFLLLSIFVCWPSLFSLISWEILGIGWLTVAKKNPC